MKNSPKETYKKIRGQKICLHFQKVNKMEEASLSTTPNDADLTKDVFQTPNALQL